MTKRKTIHWNRDRLAQLVKQHNAAVDAGKTTFTLELEKGLGVEKHPMVTAYAKHLIDYLEQQFNLAPDQPKQPQNQGDESQVKDRSW